MKKTQVIFLKEKDKSDDVFAYFPESEECFAIHEGHSICTREYAKACKPVYQKAKYVSLFNLLVSEYGYDLEVVRVF
jgi:hypothetical protein